MSNRRRHYTRFSYNLDGPFLNAVRSSTEPTRHMTWVSRRGLSIGAIVLTAFAAYWLVQPIVPERAARALSILIIAAGFWATEALPLFATAFVVIGLEITLLASEGGLADQLTALLAVLGVSGPAPSDAPVVDAAQFLAPFAQDIVILFLSGFLLSSAMSTHGVDRFLATRLLRPFAKSSRHLLYGLLGLSAFFSMWMSNTATAAMMLSLLSPLIADRPRGDSLAQCLVLAIAFGSNIGGLATPIGTPPNAIAFGALNAAGYGLTFLSWMVVAVPLTVVLLAVSGVILDRWFRPALEARAVVLLDATDAAITWQGGVTLSVLAITVGLWLTSGFHGVGPGAVGLLAVAALSAARVLGSHDVNTIDWSVLILMWGGLSLSVALEVSGLTAVLADGDISRLTGGVWVAAVATVVMAVALSTVMSNTAAAALLVPMALALSLPSSEQVAMLAALACSVAMALPVSTPPNAVAYATGRVELATMRRLGSVVTLACVGVMLVGYRVMLPLLF